MFGKRFVVWSASIALLVGAATAGLIAVQTPAQAAPGDCTKWGFPGTTSLKVTGSGPGFNVEFNDTGNSANGPAKMTEVLIKGTVDGTISAGIY